MKVSRSAVVYALEASPAGCNMTAGPADRLRSGAEAQRRNTNVFKVGVLVKDTGLPGKLMHHKVSL